MYVLAMWYSNHHLTLPWSDAELSLPFAVDMEEIPDGYNFFSYFTPLCLRSEPGPLTFTKPLLAQI